MKSACPQLLHHELVRDGFSRVALRQAAEALHFIREPSRHREQDVHAVRLRLKFLRALLQLFRESCASIYRREGTRLRRAARRLGAARDWLVARETLLKLGGDGATGERHALKRVREALALEMPGNPRWERGQEGALKRVAVEIGAAQRSFGKLRLEAKGWAAFGSGIKKSYRQARTHLLLALSRDRDEDFHEARKRIKRLYYQLQFLELAWPGRLRKLTERLHRLGAQLGVYHDLAVVKTLLVCAPGKHAAHDDLRRALGRVRKTGAALRRKIAKEGPPLLEEAPTKFAGRLERHWHRWRS